MVRERRYIFDVQDISSLIYACPHCEQEIICKLDGEYLPAKSCASCGEPLMKPRTREELDEAYVLLINLRRLLARSGPCARVRFVVPDED